MKSYRRKASDRLGDKLNDQLKKDLRANMSEAELFSFAPFDAGQAERGGYSNYSYWQATFRAFFKNKAAVFFLCLMAATLFGMEAFADNKNKTTRTVVFTSDIDCDHCAKKILDNVPVLGKGVEDVQVDVPTKRITVVYNPSKTDEATLVKGFAKLKVKAEPVREEKKK